MPGIGIGLGVHRRARNSWTRQFVTLSSGPIRYRREISRAAGTFKLDYSEDSGATWENLETIDLTEPAVVIDLAHIYHHRIVDYEYRVDNFLTALGYAGVEGADWENLYTGSGGYSQKRIDDIFEDYYIIESGSYQANDHILSIRTGSTAYLTVIDATPGAETFQCPNNDTYKTADTDYIWFKTDASQRAVTTAELIGYDLQRTPVKYLDDVPNTIEAIGILKTGKALTTDERSLMFYHMHLPYLWNNSWNDLGYEKFNRGMSQNLWVIEIPLIIYDVNTVGWYDSQDLTTITKDIVTEEVSLWKDKSDGGNDLAQVTAIKKPIWSVDGIVFDGINDLLKGVFALIQPYTIYAVFSIPDGYKADASILNGASAEGYFGTSSSAPTKFTIYSGAILSYGLINSNFNIHRLVLNGVNSSGQLNATLKVSGNAGTTNPGGLTVGSPFIEAPDGCTKCIIKEIIVRNVSDISGDNEAIYFYLKQKYLL